MLFQLKLLRSLLNPKLQKLISVFVVSFLVVGCNSLIPIYQNCNFPEQNLVPGGLINIKKKNVNLDLIDFEYFECGQSKDLRIIAPIAYNFDMRDLENIGLIIKNKEFRESRIVIKEKKFNQLSKENLKRINLERDLYINTLKKKYSSSKLNLPLLSPTKGIVSSEYGVKRFINNVRKNPHLGLDIAAKVGEPVYAAANGKVLLSENFFYRGNFILLGHAQNLKTSYSHLNKSIVKKDDEVSKGDLIGFVGSSGRVTGPHLHFEVLLLNKKIDPEVFIQNNL